MICTTSALSYVETILSTSVLLLVETKYLQRTTLRRDTPLHTDKLEMGKKSPTISKSKFQNSASYKMGWLKDGRTMKRGTNDIGDK